RRNHLQAGCSDRRRHLPAQPVVPQGDEDRIHPLLLQQRQLYAFVAKDRDTIDDLANTPLIQAGNHFVATATQQINDHLGVSTCADNGNPAHSAPPAATAPGSGLPGWHNRTLELEYPRRSAKPSTRRQAPVKSSTRYRSNPCVVRKSSHSVSLVPARPRCDA